MLKRYKKYIMPYLSCFIIGPLLMITEVVGEVLLPYLMAKIINEGVGNRDVSYIVGVGLVMAVVVVFMIIGGVGGAYFASKASASFAAGLRRDLFGKIQEFSFANIDKYSTGSLITRLTNDVTQLQNMIMMALRIMLRAPGMFIGALIMAFSINRSLALVIFAVIPVLIVGISIIMRIGMPRFTLMQKKIDRVNAGTQEALTNVRVVKSFVREEFEDKKFQEINQDLKDTSIRALKVMIITMPLMNIAMNLTTLAVVWFGGNQIINGSMMVGDLTAFTTYIVQILMSLMMIAQILLNSSRALASHKRIAEVLDEKIDLTDENAAYRDKQVTAGKIEFRNVSFGYYKDNGEKVLNNISFTVNPGETVGIIGSTGSGKTSLVQLIPRLYDADSGMVLVDDTDVKDYSLHHLREGVGMVLQKNLLFSGTIAENLRWGCEEASMEEISWAAQSAQAHGFVQGFTDGYETELGQGGVNVSGGQKQRLCIARALLKRPKILILDDSTSAVDTATEARIRECFYHELKDTTKLIIAQRIGSVREADKIIVLDDGQIAGMGTHEALMKNCPAYQEIYESQMDKEESAV